MDDTDECFICLYGDEEVGKGRMMTLNMTHCGCSPRVHSTCLVEWYTGTGADGRDICPVCRTRGRIQGIAEILQRVVLSGPSDISLTDHQDRYHRLPDTENVPPPPQPPPPQGETAEQQERTVAQQRRNQQTIGVMIIVLVLVIMFVYTITNINF